MLFVEPNIVVLYLANKGMTMLFVYKMDIVGVER